MAGSMLEEMLFRCPMCSELLNLGIDRGMSHGYRPGGCEWKLFLKGER